MKLLCTYRTRIGTAKIIFDPGIQRYIAAIGDEALGNYPTAQGAVDDLAGGHTFSHSSGVDTATLGLPDDVLDWERASNSNK